MKDDEALEQENNFDIAIVGLSGRFPGANNLTEFWQNLCSGVESVTFFSDDELVRSAINPAVLDDPSYIKAAPILDGPELFDASFFGYAPREAELTDPQQRLFLECAWQALEHAGYDPERYAGRIGVYAGSSVNSYLLYSGLAPRVFTEDYLSILIGNAQDYLSTRVSYKLNLRGPSVSVLTACSTSLVAVHMACQSLLNEECDMALAGGVSVRVPHKAGYWYQEGSIVSPDGHCRAFDAKAHGTIFGSGLGIVVLKRLTDAIADRDCIYAVIKGSAINNDGSSKVAFTAPSVDAQAEAIVEAMANSGVEAETITFIEAHGTGTLLGDPVEVAALTKAFSTFTDSKGFCAIGSVKPNIGHLDAAAGIASVIKTVLALQHKMLPPLVHFEKANPAIDFENSPFYVNRTLSEWRTNGHPRRAGVTSLGVGGTNAHVVMEEAPPPAGAGLSRPYQVLMLSARTERALDAATENLRQHLQEQPDVHLADVAYTLQVGRKSLNRRRVLVCQDVQDAVAVLETRDGKRLLSATADMAGRPVAFMFSGQGAQYVDMGLGLYQSEPVFRETIDRCAEILQPLLGLDLREVMYPAGADSPAADRDAEAAAERLQQTAITQPAIFAIEYALARLWIEWGIQPRAVIGHSIGEYTAACIAGVFSLEEGLALVAERGRLMQALPGGTMLIVFLPETEVQPYLSEEVSLAAINGPSLCVLSGPAEAIAAVQSQLAEREVQCRPLQTSHAFHSAMMEPMLEPFAARVRQVDLKPPRIPFVSCLTANWATAELADPDYWVRHVRQPVRFAGGVERLLQEPGQILLEVGPGRTLSTLAKRHPARAAEQPVLDSLRHPQDEQPDVAYTLGALGKLWLEGAQVDWDGFYVHEQRHRLALPTYPFERQRFWIEPSNGHMAAATAVAPTAAAAALPTAAALPSAKAAVPIVAMPASGWEDAPLTLRRAAAQAPSTPSAWAYEDAPRDEVEQRIAALWQDVLGVRQPKVHDDFFELGGHSMLLASLAIKVRKAFGRDLPVQAFFETSTLEELADLMRDGARSEEAAPVAETPPEEGQPARAHNKLKPRRRYLPGSLRVQRDPNYPDRIRDTVWNGLKCRLFQQIASWIPGAKSARVWLHRQRGVKIGEDVFIGYGVVLESAYPKLIAIGSHVFISVRTVMIGHFMGSGMRAKLQGGRSIRIEDEVAIGPNVIILPNVTVGRGSVIAAGSVVSASVPPLTMVQGNPARAVARCGVPLIGNSYDKFINSLTLLDGEG